MTAQRHLFLTADDRTGALEVGGVAARPDFSVPVGPRADSRTCCVVDLASRHLEPQEAYERTRAAHEREADHRCHKMDSGLRGNWPHEIRALVDLGYEVAVVPSFPDAGRMCVDGTVYIQGVPVLESPFGSDPRTAPCSSKPIEVMENAGCTTTNVEIFDAATNDELRSAVSQAHRKGQVLVGPTGAIGEYVNRVYSPTEPSDFLFEPPLLVVCGSLNSVSRQQLELLNCEEFGIEDRLAIRDDVVALSTPKIQGSVDSESAQSMSSRVSTKVHSLLATVKSLLIIGGDTVAAVVGDDTIDAFGCVAAGVPISRWRGLTLITKGGGIGIDSTLCEIVQKCSVNSDDG